MKSRLSRLPTVITCVIINYVKLFDDAQERFPVRFIGSLAGIMSTGCEKTTEKGIEDAKDNLGQCIILN